MGASGRRWGWHRLDPDWAERLVDEAALPRRALVLDIGAGEGALTGPLVAAGLRVVAVEAHPGRARRLRGAFGERAVVVQADAADLRLPRRPFHVVANPPFGITSAVLRRLLHPGSRLESAHLVLQVQALRRWVAADAPGRRGWDHRFVVVPGRPLPRTALRPAAPVPVQVLEVHRRRRSTGPRGAPP